MTDKRGKLFSKINIVDIAISALVVVAVLACAYKLSTQSNTAISGEDKKLVLTVEAEGLREFSASQFEAGDEIFDDKDNKYIGEITDVKLTPAKGYITKFDGTIVSSEVPEKYNVLITIEADGVVNENGYYVKGNLTQIVPNSGFSFSNVKVAVGTKVKSVEVID